MYILQRILKTLLGLVITGAIAYGIIFAGVKVYQLLQEKANQTEQQEEEQSEDNETTTDNSTKPTVKTITVKPAKKNDDNSTNSDELFKKTGLIVADQEIDIVSELGAKVIAINVQEGEEIKANKQVAQLGDSIQAKQLASSYQSAIESLKLAEESLNLTAQSGQLSQISSQQQINSANVSIRQAINQLNFGREVRGQQYFVQDLQKDAAEQAQAQTTEVTETEQTNEQEQIINPIRRRTGNTSKLEGNELAERILQEQQAQLQELGTKNQIEQSQLQLEQLATALESSKVASQLQQVNVYNQLVQIRGQIEQAQISLSALKLNSPINGIVSKVHVRPGETVNPGSPLITVTNFDSIIIETKVSTNDLMKLTQNTQVQIKIGNEQVAGKIVSVGVVADAISKTIPVKIVPVEATNFPLIPNTFAQISFKKGSVLNSENSEIETVSIPLNSIKFSDKKTFVAVVENKKVAYREVKIKKISKGKAIIENNFTKESKIIITPRLPKIGTPISNA